MFNKRKDIAFPPGNTFRARLQFFLAVWIGIVFILTSGYAAKATNTAIDVPTKGISMEEQWGVKIESIRTSANGHLVDFRYRIKDSDKAVPLVDRRNKPYLIDQASGKVLAVPNTAKVGPMRATVRYGKPKEDRVYFVLFGNAGGMVKPGDEVTVVIGDFRAENLTVE
jgi:hypothetical protein